MKIILNLYGNAWDLNEDLGICAFRQAVHPRAGSAYGGQLVTIDGAGFAPMHGGAGGVVNEAAFPMRVLWANATRIVGWHPPT